MSRRHILATRYGELCKRGILLISCAMIDREISGRVSPVSLNREAVSFFLLRETSPHCRAINRSPIAAQQPARPGVAGALRFAAAGRNITD